MTKKALDAEAMVNELRGQSAFFTREEPTEAEAPGEAAEERDVQAESQTSRPDSEMPGHHDTTQPRHHDTVVSRHHDVVEAIRRAVKEVGKEAATHRFTPAEKQAVSDVIYTYGRRGIRTSENEVARIAVNYLLADYQENGENSVLDRVLKKLNE